mmetsp:Transcript_55795/g.84443  ORF Transcript_55795/g.84443 Transcript_55795/m.84443 type:complete len:141 (+) Transcript_55795:25-447(+)
MANDKAKKVAGALKKGSGRKATRVHTKVHFYKPKTATRARKPMYTRKAVPAMPRWHKWRIIQTPLSTPDAMKKMEDANTLVVLVDLRANKKQIKRAFKQRFEVDVAKVNTLIRPDGKKKAYVKLSPDADAVDLAHKLQVL